MKGLATLGAIGLTFALAAPMWVVAGQPSRSPRLPGRPEPATDPTAPMGGIGRFAEPRTGRARRVL